MAVVRLTDDQFIGVKRTLSEVFEYEAKENYSASNITGVKFSKLKTVLSGLIKKGDRVASQIEKAQKYAKAGDTTRLSLEVAKIEQIGMKPFIEAYAITNLFGQYMRQEPIRVTVFVTTKGKDLPTITNAYDYPEMQLLREATMAIEAKQKRCLLKLNYVINSDRLIDTPSVNQTKIHQAKIIQSMEKVVTNNQTRYRPTLEVAKRYAPQNSHLIVSTSRVAFARGDHNVGYLATFNNGNIVEGVDNAISNLIHHKQEITDSAVENLFYGKYLNNNPIAQTRGPDNNFTDTQTKTSNATITKVSTATNAARELLKAIEVAESQKGEKLTQDIQKYVHDHLISDDRLKNDFEEKSQEMVNSFIEQVKNSFKNKT